MKRTDTALLAGGILAGAVLLQGPSPGPEPSRPRRATGRIALPPECGVRAVL